MSTTYQNNAMASPSIVSNGDKIRKMIASLSPDDIARLIPKETLTSLLRANDEKKRLRELPATTKVVAAANKSKKKVNGFMAFRSYYADIFQDRPQKERSPFITLLWQKETLKARWIIMANVFSRIRDFASITRGRMAMSGFLRVACPLMGITKPCDYLRRYNWQLEFVSDLSAAEPDTAMRYEIFQSEIPHLVDDFEVPTSEIELLRECIQGGFPFENSAQLLRDMEDSSVTIMTRAAPLPTVSCASNVSQFQQTNHFINTLINDPDAAISALLPQDEDIGSLIIDMDIIHSLETDSSATSSARNSVSPLEQNTFFHEHVSIDPSRMVSFPGEGHGSPHAQYNYPNPTLGLW